MTDRIINLTNRYNPNIVNLYVTDTELTYRVLNPIEDVPEDAVKHEDDLMNHDSYDTSVTKHVWTIKEKNYLLETDTHIQLQELQPYDWLCGAEVRLFTRSYAGWIWGYNTRCVSYISKHDRTTTRKIITNESMANNPIKFMPRTRTDTFLTAPMQLVLDNSNQLLSNIEFGQTINASEEDTFWDSHILHIVLDGPKTIEADGYASLTVTAKYGDEVFKCNESFIIDAVDGYAPHKRVTLSDGVGTFKIKALDLVAGEQCRVKINSRFETSLVEWVFEVV